MCSSPLNSRTIEGIAVSTMVWSKTAKSMASMAHSLAELQRKYRRGVCQSYSGDLLVRNTLERGYLARHVGYIRGLVAFAAVGHRRGKGRVRLNKHLVCGAHADRVVVHVGVGNGARERKIAAEAQVFLCQLARAGKKMQHNRHFLIL